MLWLIKDIGPNLLILGEQLAQCVRSHPLKNPNVAECTIKQIRNTHAFRLLAAHRWVDRHGNDILLPPFPLSLRCGKGAASLNQGQWPPTRATHIIKLLELLQLAHIFIALLAVGSRISEMLSLEPGTITYSSDGTSFANGLTFKLTHLIDGEERDWPVPEVVVETINQQEVLRKIFVDIGFWSREPNDEYNLSKSIWITYGTLSEFQSGSINANLRVLIHSIGLPTDPDNQNLSTHRFRKTLARLVALAVVGAPKILMDLFGHKTIEMTLHYILSDPDIAAEAKQISEELTIMRAVNAIENIHEYGGLAAQTIKCRLEQEKFRFGKDFGADNIRELAEILTMNGQSWELARPGVICTKLPGSYGECAKNVGVPEPSHCGSGCDYRLEEAFLRKDVDSSIADSVKHYEAERDADNGLMQDFWAGQVLTHLKRFDDLREKWSTNSSVQEILSNEAQPE